MTTKRPNNMLLISKLLGLLLFTGQHAGHSSTNAVWKLRLEKYIVPERDGVFSGLEFRTDLRDKYSTAAPAQLRQYGPLSNVVRKAYER